MFKSVGVGAAIIALAMPAGAAQAAPTTTQAVVAQPDVNVQSYGEMKSWGRKHCNDGWKNQVHTHTWVTGVRGYHRYYTEYTNWHIWGPNALGRQKAFKTDSNHSTIQSTTAWYSGTIGHNYQMCWR